MGNPAPEGARITQVVSVCLKAYPDTNLLTSYVLITSYVSGLVGDNRRG